jgi:sigma-B regulation protein RsbU (phosphoserine phosphatase)
VTERGSGKALGTVVLRLSRGVIEQALRQGRRSAMILGLGSLGSGLLGAVILVTFILRPVGFLTRGAEAIGRGDLSSRIDVVSRDEIGSLAATFNDMAARLEVAQMERIEREKVLQELRIAHQIQEALLPSGGPDVKELDMTSYYRAATEVGGDYYDFIEPAPGSVGVIVADVSGKGVPGSLVMTMVRSVMRSVAGGIMSPRDVLTRTNRMIIDDMKPGMFVTAQYCIFDLSRREYFLASAGHNGLIHLAAGSEQPTILTPKGMALGLDRGLIFDNLMEEQRQAYTDEDLFFMYTDGVTEAMNPSDEEFGEERLVRFLVDNRRLGSAELSRELNRVLEGFIAGARQHDDITYVAVKVKRGAA